MDADFDVSGLSLQGACWLFLNSRTFDRWNHIFLFLFVFLIPSVGKATSLVRRQLTLEQGRGPSPATPQSSEAGAPAASVDLI